MAPPGRHPHPAPRSSERGSSGCSGAPERRGRGRLRFAITLFMALAVVPAAPLLRAEASPPAPSAAIRDIRGPFPATKLPPFALTCLALVIAGVLMLTLVKTPHRRPAIPPPARPGREGGAMPGDSLDELISLYRSGDCSPGLTCQRLSVLLRNFLACRTGLPASRLTTGELLDAISNLQLLSSEELAAAGQMLSFCDRVKFAGHDPDPAEADWLLACAGKLLGRAAEVRHEAP